MANFQVAPKLRVINSADQFVVAKMALKANGAYEAAAGADAPAIIADTDLYKIEGFAELHRGKVRKAVKTLSIAPQKQAATLTITGSTFTPGKEISVEMIVKSSNLEHEFVQFDGRNQKNRFYNHAVRSGDTLTTIAARVAAAFNMDGENGGNVLVTATSAAGVVTITPGQPGWTVSFKITGSAIEDGNLIFTFAQTAAAFEGRNVYRQMNVKRLQNPNRTYPYATGHYVAANEVPTEGAVYSSVIVEFEVDRPDLSGPEMQNSGPTKGIFGIELYFKENDAAVVTLRNDLVNWLKSAADLVEEYNATTAAAAVAAESPVVTTN
jgi:hypothetical protein